MRVCRYMYDGELEAQMYMIFDANKHLISTADIYPEVSPPTSCSDNCVFPVGLWEDHWSCVALVMGSELIARLLAFERLVVE